MTHPKIAIVIGSVRPGRFSEKSAAWIGEIALQRADLVAEVIDLADYSLPFFAEAMPPAWGPVQNEAAQRWKAKVAEFDGYIFVTPEYNHGVPAVLKNALDYISTEFMRKPAAFVGHGGMGAARAIEQLRLTLVELQMVSVRNAVHLGMAELMGIARQGKSFGDFPHLAQAATGLLDELVWWAKALSAARTSAT